MNFEQARRRQHPRVPAGFLVKLHTGGKQIVRKARDLSLTGLLVEGECAELEDRIVVELPLPNEQRVVVVTARVVRDAPSAQSALHFLDLDWDDMFALARFLAPRLP